jgi:hypothetical protein
MFVSYRHYGEYAKKVHIILGYSREENKFLVLDTDAMNEKDRDEIGGLVTSDFAMSKFNLHEVLSRELHRDGGDWFSRCIKYAAQVPAREVRLFDKEQADHWMGDPTNFVDPENNNRIVQPPVLNSTPRPTPGNPPAEVLEVLRQNGELVDGLVERTSESNLQQGRGAVDSAHQHRFSEGLHVGEPTSGKKEAETGISVDEFHELQGQVKAISKSVKEMTGAVRNLTRSIKAGEEADKS